MKNILLLTFSLFNVAIFSQSTDSLSIKKKDIPEVVITGQLSEVSPDKAIHRVRVIDNKMLSSGIFQNLASILEKEMNIQLLEDNVLGSSISLQGISGQNVKILIDEIPVIGRLNGNIDLSQISLNNIERIEIVEGPLSTIYGTDALAGTINIISKKNFDNKKHVNTYYESIGKYNYDILLNNNNKHNTIIYNFGRKYFNGWSENQKFEFIPTSQIADTNRVKKWKPKEQLLNKITWKINKRIFTINTYFENFYEKITNLGKPKEPYYENAFDEFYYTYRTNLGSDINIKTASNENIRILIAYNKYIRHKESFYTDLTNLSRNIISDPNAQDTSEFDLVLTKLIISNEENKKIRYQIGTDLKYQSTNGKRILNNYQNESNIALFSIIEYEVNKIISLRPSARIIYNTKYKAPFVPAVNLLFDLNNYKLRFSYARGFRAPDFKELFLDFVDVNHNIVGNPLLQAEESNNYQLNLNIKKQLSRTNINTDISLFQNNIYNKIDLTNNSSNIDQYSYFNIEEYKTKGISAITSISLNKISFNIGGSYTGRFNNLSKQYEATAFNFSLDYNMNTTITLGNYTKLNLFYKNTGRVPNFILDNDNVYESYSEPYHLMDISINRRLFDDLLVLTIGGKNLFNIKDIKRYGNENAVHSTSNNSISIGYGRSFFTTLNFRL
tara:strand:- start:509 stop:2521 length:2013 start_codon:yes stop_codon:yes gene_type:complete